MTLALGHQSVRDCQQAVSSREFAEWLAFYRIQPFGALREDQRAGVVAAVIANVNRDSRKRSKAYDWADFFPQRTRHAARQSWQEQLLMVEFLNTAFGGDDRRADADLP